MLICIQYSCEFVTTKLEKICNFKKIRRFLAPSCPICTPSCFAPQKLDTTRKVNEKIACVSSGRTLEELKQNMDATLRWHIDSMKNDGESIPQEFDGEWALEWSLSVRALLHYTEGLIPKAAIAKATGINQQQLTHYALGYRTPRPAMRAKIIEGLHIIGRQLLAIS